MAKKDIKDFVCKPFCSFYREGVKEELICNGARLVEILMKRGVLSLEAILEVQPGPIPTSWKDAAQGEAVCRECPFRAEDCDFRSDSPPPDAVPCGGFILLALLAANGVISMEGLPVIDNG